MVQVNGGYYHCYLFERNIKWVLKNKGLQLSETSLHFFTYYA